jgi:hypothetical protein
VKSEKKQGDSGTSLWALDLEHLGWVGCKGLEEVPIVAAVEVVEVVALAVAVDMVSDAPRVNSKA